MGNVGHTLEEARKRQGMSIREASEVTKIRTEYLSNFENDNFDFDLPDVYKRGFVKMYAKLLKMDVEPFMADVDALMQGRGKNKGGREFFGRMDLQGSNAQDSSPANAFNEGESGVGVAFKKGGAANVPAAERLELGTDKTLYWKIGLIFIGTFVVVGLLALLIQTIFSGSDAPTTQGGSQSAIVQNATPTVIVIAKGDARVAAQELTSPNRRLIDSETLKAGDRRTIYPQGDFRIVSNKVENLDIEIDGNPVHHSASGTKQFKFDARGNPL